MQDDPRLAGLDEERRCLDSIVTLGQLVTSQAIIVGFVVQLHYWR